MGIETEIDENISFLIYITTWIGNYGITSQ
jgi:hypothetical protein